MFFEKFTKCRDLEALRHLCAQTHIELRSYSRLAFRQLSGSGQPLEVLLSFLEDPSLNDPKARNLRFLLKSQFERYTTTDDLQGLLEPLRQWVERQLALGNLSDEQIRHLSKFVVQLGKESHEESLKCDWMDAILKGLESSPLLNLQHLGSSTVITLLHSLSQGVFTRRSQDLGCCLLEALQPSLLQKMAHNISAFILTGMQSQACSLQGERSHASEMASVATALALIKRLPLDTAQSVITITSQSMVQLNFNLPISRDSWLIIMKEWWSSLAKSGLLISMHEAQEKKQFGYLMGFQSTRILAPYLQHFDNHKKASFLSKHWFTVSPDFGGCNQPGESCEPFFAMLQAAQDHCQLSEQLIARFFVLLQQMQLSEHIVTIISESRSKGINVPLKAVLHAIESHLSVSVDQALDIHKADTRLLLESCPELAEKIIEDPKIPTRLIWRYRRERHQVCDRQAFFDRPENLLQAQVFLLEKMAVAYAQARHLRPRKAFRHVQICYTNARQYSRPISVLISRALNMTGIVRQLQCSQWVSSVKLRWILAIIREVEGPRIADDVDRLVYQWRGENCCDNASKLRRQRNLEIAAARLTRSMLQ